MAGTTTNFGIQYPSITDYVTDGATAMKTIADKVDDILFAEVANNNLIINGAMQVSQRSAVGTAVTGITTSGYYTADRFKTTINALGTFSQTTIADAPSGSGFRNSLKLACTTADASPAAGDFFIFQQIIEGQNLQAIRKGTASAKKLTLSFWVKSFQTGIFICELVDSDNSRSCSKSYTVLASNTWEYKTISFPADTTGVLDNDANGSLEVNFWLGAGTTFTSGTLATTWATVTSANRAVGVNNLASSTSNTWFMTGLSLTVGDVDVPFQFKSISEDLQECQRYYQRLAYQTTNYIAIGQVYPTNNVYAVIDLPTSTRIAATSITVSGTTFALDAGAIGRGITVAMANATTFNIGINATGSFNLTNGHAALLAFSSAPNYIELNGTEL
jgi:hypothetical protein